METFKNKKTVYAVNSSNENHFFTSLRAAKQDLTCGVVPKGEIISIFKNKIENTKDWMGDLDVDTDIFFDGNEIEIMSKKF